MRFEVIETQTVCDGLVVRWQSKIWVNHPEISASRNGVSIAGAWPVMSEDSTAQVIALLCDASRIQKELAAGTYRKGSAAAIYATTRDGAEAEREKEKSTADRSSSEQ